MRIQELERRTGMDRATIRFYEKEGLIEPKRSENGYRDYTDENAAELKKIRLLRQLGMSVFTIRQLQQGSADFLQALADQVQRLSDQIEENKRAKAVCQTIHDDGAEYGTLDAEHYLHLLQTIRMDTPKKEFQEDIPREIHPWRRWLARTLDYWWLGVLVDFVIVVLLRIRPLPGAFMDTVILILTGALLIPIEAFLLHRFGTTPGKFTMGIRLESVNGGNLTMDGALRRGWAVYKEGVGFRIPILSLVMMAHKYLRLTGRTFLLAKREYSRDPEEMYWDEETEIIYTPVAGKRWLALAALASVAVTLGILIGFDGIKPKYRSEELTIAQFAENYNHCLQVFAENADTTDMLQPDGRKNPIPAGTVVVDLTGESYNPGERMNEFEYEQENGFVKSVTIQRSFEDVFYASAISLDMINLTFTLALSQPECGYEDLTRLAEMLDASVNQTQANITYDNIILIEWVIETENCRQVNDGYYITDDDTLPSSMHVTFTVTIP